MKYRFTQLLPVRTPNMMPDVIIPIEPIAASESPSQKSPFHEG